MQSHTLCQNSSVIASFEDAHDTPLCVGIRDAQHGSRESFKIFCFEPQRADRIVLMTVKTSADED